MMLLSLLLRYSSSTFCVRNSKVRKWNKERKQDRQKENGIKKENTKQRKIVMKEDSRK